MPEATRRTARSALEHVDGAAVLLDSLPDDYFQSFPVEQIVLQLTAAAGIGRDSPVRVLGAGPGNLTICALDTPGLFSLLTGALGAAGFNILSGRVYTAAGTGTPSRSAVAIDTFSGTITGTTTDSAAAGFPAWLTALQGNLIRYLRLQGSPARDAVAHAVAEKIAGEKPEENNTLLPIQIQFETGMTTRISVQSQDTPFFLYSLSSALSFQNINVERVEIETREHQISDTFWVTDLRGNPVNDQAELDRLRVSILLTKEFTNALPQAADPYAAFTRFEELVRSVAGAPAGKQLQDLLADPERQKELARLLGASTFLWEDFIRLQYESLLPLLRYDNEHQLLSTRSDELEAHLEEKLSGAADFEDRCRILNEFKDHEAYLIDADHILRRNNDFFFLSHRLTRLAELVVRTAFVLAWEKITGEYGVPRTAGGLPAEYAIFGLGKMGGSALGYASDIELLFVYGDHGETDRVDRRIRNQEFFERLVKLATGLIIARREGIFRVDLRLRPYGDDGPLAVHLETIVSYYGPGGQAHSAERLALIRLRPIGGSTDLGRQITAIRDQFVYDAINVSEIRELRMKQVREKTGPGRLNAKFSPGALVDLEYNVQLLQIEHGRTNPQLRNPGIHATLRALSDAGAIAIEEADDMVQAYQFLRNLINALRMLRGDARDLDLPDFGTIEYVHLARRMAYTSAAGLTAEEQLRADFQTHTAMIRTFVERHMGEDAIAHVQSGNPADLILSDALREEWSSTLLRDAGFRIPDRGVENLRRIAGSHQTLFARLIVVAWNYLSRSSDPDMALNNWERFVEKVADRASYFSDLLAQPRRMEIMFTVFSGSQFLSDTLIRNPEFLSWISDPAVIGAPRNQHELYAELGAELSNLPGRTDRINRLRLFRKREILRIGVRDICLGGEFTEIIAEISALARACIQVSCDIASSTPGNETVSGNLAILAFGKLGGGELNYSSDIDLLAVYRPPAGEVANAETEERRFAGLFKQVVRDLSDFSEEGRAYRVDLRLRPYGNAGRLVYTLAAAQRYYEREAELWELQALLKLSPVAGNLELGHEFLEQLRPVFAARLKAAGRNQILSTIRHLRNRAVQEHHARENSDIKNGEGGIRDIEFLVQAEQMMHYHLFPGLFTGSTLVGLDKLEEVGIIDGATTALLKRDYILLRRVEHFLQVYDDRQLHSVPREPTELAKLTAVILGPGHENAELRDRLDETIRRVRGLYDAYLTNR